MTVPSESTGRGAPQLIKCLFYFWPAQSADWMKSAVQQEGEDSARGAPVFGFNKQGGPWGCATDDSGRGMGRKNSFSEWLSAAAPPASSILSPYGWLTFTLAANLYTLQLFFPPRSQITMSWWVVTLSQWHFEKEKTRTPSCVAQVRSQSELNNNLLWMESFRRHGRSMSTGGVSDSHTYIRTSIYPSIRTDV